MENKARMKRTPRFYRFRDKTKKFSAQMIRMNFASVFIIFIVLLCAINIIILRQNIAGVAEISDAILNENRNAVQKNIESMFLVESIVKTNSRLLHELIFPDSVENLAEQIIAESAGIERMIAVEPNLYSVNIFTENEKIPERFPVFLNARRTDFSVKQKWQFNTLANYYDNSIMRYDPLVIFTDSIEHSARKIAQIKIAMRTPNFFPFLARPQKYSRDWAFQILPEKEGGGLLPIAVSGGNILDTKSLEKAQKIFVALESGKNEFHARMKFNEKKVALSACLVPEIGIFLVHTEDLSQIHFRTAILFLTSLFGAIVFGIVLFLIIKKITMKITSGVYSIVSGMQQVRAGAFDVQIPVDGTTDEIAQSQETFNSMTRTLQSQIEQIKEKQRFVMETQIKAMQNQINAHFLYNTLETIRMQALLNNDSTTSESVFVLGKMMRYCMKWQVPTVSLRQEIEYLNSYVYILNISSDVAVKLQVEIPDSLLEFLIPKMIVQPLVENSFYHAVESSMEEIAVNFFSRVEGETLYLCVQDFGAGISQEKLSEILEYLRDDVDEREENRSIGLKNIQTRLSIFYGKEFRLKIVSQIGRGTTIQIPIPCGAATSMGGV